MPFEKKGGCIGAEATFCTNEKLTRLDQKKIKKANIQKLQEMGFF